MSEPVGPKDGPFVEDVNKDSPSPMNCTKSDYSGDINNITKQDEANETNKCTMETGQESNTNVNLMAAQENNQAKEHTDKERPNIDCTVPLDKNNMDKSLQRDHISTSNQEKESSTMEVTQIENPPEVELGNKDMDTTAQKDNLSTVNSQEKGPSGKEVSNVDSPSVPVVVDRIVRNDDLSTNKDLENQIKKNNSTKDMESYSTDNDVQIIEKQTDVVVLNDSIESDTDNIPVIMNKQSIETKTTGTVKDIPSGPSNIVSNVNENSIRQDLISFHTKYHIRNMHVVEVLRACGTFLEKKLFSQLIEKINIPKNIPNANCPVEPLNLNDDYKSCKILDVLLPKTWGRLTVCALLNMKTTFDVHTQFISIYSIEDGMSPRPNTKIFLLRFASPEVCMSMMKELRLIQLFNKKLTPKLDTGYVKARTTKFFTFDDKPLNSNYNKMVVKHDIKTETNARVAETDVTSNRITTSNPEGMKSGAAEANLSVDTSGDRGGNADDDKNCTVIVLGNLPTDFTVAPVKAFLKPYATPGAPFFELKPIRWLSGQYRCCVQCFDHETAARLQKELQGKEFMGKKLEVGFDRENLFKTNISDLNQMEWSRSEALGDDGSDQDQPPAKVRRYNDPALNGLSMKAVFIPPRERNMSLYGLKGEFLHSLGIVPPLSEVVFVNNLHREVDNDKLHEIFSLAGNIKTLKITKDNDKETNRARIAYDHPVEAVQAVAMFDKQTIFHLPIIVKMDCNRKRRMLPLGLQSIGKGLGPNGAPLSGIRTYVEVKNVQKALANLDVMKEEKNPTSPFQVFSYSHKSKNDQSDNKPNTSTPPQGIREPHVISQPPNLYGKHIQVLSQRSVQPKFNVPPPPPPVQKQDGNVKALHDILKQHGLIDKNKSFTDLSDIVSALRKNETPNQPVTSHQTGPNFAANMQSNLPSSHTQPYYYMQHNMAPNVPSMGTNVSQMTPNVPSPNPNVPPIGSNVAPMELNVPQMGQNVPQMGQNVPQMGQNVPPMGQNVPPMGQNVPAMGQNVPPMGQNAPQFVTCVPSMVPMYQHTVTQVAWEQVAPPQTQTAMPNYSQYQLPSNQNYQNLNEIPVPQGNPEFAQPKTQTNYITQKAPKPPKPPQRQIKEIIFDTEKPKKQAENSKMEEDGTDILIFKNLPSSVTMQALHTKMREVGELIFCEMTSQGRAIVRFKKNRDAERCLKLFHRSKVDGQAIDVKYM